MTPSSSLAVSNRRSEVEPTATIRPPACRRRFSAAAVSAATLPCSQCTRCAAVSATLTGRNVPAPTRSVTLYRMIPRAIAPVGRAPDVGRQRHGAAIIDRLVQNGPMKCKRERDFPVFAFSFDGGIELAEEADLALVPEAHHVAGRQPLGGFYEGAPARAIEALVQRRLDGGLHCAAADATPAQASRNDLSIVDHKRVTGAQQVGQIAHAAVIELRRRAWTHD